MELSRWLRCLLLLVLLAPGLAVAGGEIPVAEGSTRLSLNEGLLWWQPSHAGATVDDAQRAAFSAAPSGPGYGMAEGPLWFRVDVRNLSAERRDFLLDVGFSKLDFLDVHILRADGGAEHWATGEARPWATRALPSSRFLFPLSLAPDEPVRVLLRVDTGAVVNLPLALHDANAYIGVTSNRHAWLGLFYGLVLGLLAYNAYLFRATRETAFLYYVAGGVLALGYFLSVDGYFAAWLPTRPVAAQWLLFMGAALSASCTLLFSRMFLNLARIAPRLDRALLWVAMGAALVALLVPWLSSLVAMALTVAVSIAMAALMSVAGVIALRTGFRPARWFVLAISVHLTVLVLLTLTLLAIAPWPFEFADTLHRVGFTLNLLCFTLAIGDRIEMLASQARAADERVLEAAADVRARNEFLSRMSHELRTPMTGILGMTELLEHTELAPVQRRYLGTLRYSGEMLLTLISDVLDHARLHAGRLQLSSEAFDLLRLLDDCRVLFAQQPREGNLPLRTDFGAGLGRVAVGDAPRLRQVLVNLLAQAHRQTTRAPVVLRVRGMNQPGWLRFEIEAGAEGRDEARRLLADTGVTRGTLGLLISRELVEAMGGRIGISGEDVTLFWFELPLNVIQGGG